MLTDFKTRSELLDVAGWATAVVNC